MTVQSGSIFCALGPVPLIHAPATVSVNPSSFILSPGASQTVVATIKGPSGLDESMYPVYSGFIEISDGAQKFHVTYQGLVGSLIDKQVTDDTDTFFGHYLPAVVDNQGNVQDGLVNYTFVGEDFPTIQYRYVLFPF
jgi:hypothetical protein